MRALLVPAIVFAGCSSASPPPPQKKDATTPAAGGTPASEALDSGKFVLTVGDETVGEETFEILERPGGFEIKTTTKIGDGRTTVEQAASLNVDGKGKPLSATISGKQGDKTSTAKLTRIGGGLVIDADGQTIKEQRPSDLFIANGIVMHFAPICAFAGDQPRLMVTFPGRPLGIEPAVVRKMEILDKDGKKVQAEIVTVIVDYAGARIELACDGIRLMSLFQPGTGILAARPGFEIVARRLSSMNRPKPELPDTLVEQDRLVPSGDVTLACALVVPKNQKGKLPGVVFITGSGAEDRDGDPMGGGGYSLFKELAIALGQAGIASLRCDDRGVGRSTGSFTKATLPLFAADTTAALAALRKEAGIDGRRLGLVGHSEGATVAPLVAAGDPQLKAVVLLAGTSRSLEVLMVEQIGAAARRRGASDADVDKSVAELKQGLEAVRAGKPMPDTVSPQTRQFLEGRREWFASHLTHDPAAQLAKVKQPVFVARGDGDTQMLPADSEAVRDTLAKAGNKRVLYKAYPGLNHFFAGGGTDDRGTKVDGAFMGDVVTFLSKSL